MIHFMEKISSLGKLCLGINYSAVGYDFKVNESTMFIKYSIFKQKHTQSKVMYWLADENVATRGSQVT